MKKHARLASILLIASAGGCTTSYGPASDEPVISYRLPETVITASGTLTVEGCRANTMALSGILVVAAEAVPTDTPIELTSRQLMSNRFRRTLSVELHENGTIASVNSAVEDRLPAIIGSIFSTALDLLPVFGAARQTQPESVQHGRPCSSEVVEYLARVDRINDEVARIRDHILSGTGNPQQLLRRHEALLSERTWIRQNVLTVPFREDLPLAGAISSIPIGDVLEPLLARDGSVLLHLRVEPPRATAPEVQYPCTGLSLCLPAASIPMETWKVAVVGSDGPIVEGQETAPVPQWAEPVEIPLRVGFAGNREYSATFDSFGRQQSASWGSEARGEAIATMISGSAGAAAELVAATRGRSELDRQLAEIERLETQQRLNRLRACSDILAAGGSNCPAEAEPN